MNHTHRYLLALALGCGTADTTDDPDPPVAPERTETATPELEEPALTDVSTEAGAVADWLVTEHEASRVAIVVVDAATGEIVGAAGRGPLGEGEVDRQVPSASTIKSFTIAAALDAGLDPERRFETDEGQWHSGDLTLRDAHPQAAHDARSVLVLSSNVGAANIVSDIGPEKVHALLSELGVDAGSADEWSGDEGVVRAAHGIPVAPSEWARAYAALATGGSAAVSPALAARVRDMLESAVGSEGTGHRAAVRGLPIAGKTGTSEVDDGRGCWFVGIAPAGDPRWVAAVYAEVPEGVGGTVAAPAFARLARAIER